MNREFRKSSAGFTLLEIMITIGIIVILAVVLLAVGSNVKSKSQISATKTQLKSLEGIIEQFEKDNSAKLPTTTYDSNGSQLVPTVSATSPNFIEALYRYPATKDQLVNLFGDKLKINPAGGSAVLDSFGNPINFIQEGEKPTNTSTFALAPREYLRTAGPDKTWNPTTENSSVNLDDILSTEATR